MSSSIRISIMVSVAVGLFGSSLITHAQEKNAQEYSSKLLVSPDWLEQQIKSNSKLRILDLPHRKTNYKVGHVPGAVYVDWRSDIISSQQRSLYQLPTKAEMEKLLSRLGVTPDTTIVVTDDLQNRASVRMYYTLKYFGHKDVRILNGGTIVWFTAKNGLSTEVPKIKPTEYSIQKLNKEYVAKIEAVQNAIDDANCTLIDGRPVEQFTGAAAGKAFHTNKAHARRGHVPTAESIPWAENLNHDGTFKSIEELKKLYQSHGINTDDGEVIAYCNEGLHAAMPWFVIKELFGNPNVTVYDNSMVEWANREDTPLEKSSK